MAVNTRTHSQTGQAKVSEHRPDEETDRLGTEIYERDIRHLVEADHSGKIVAIDVDTGTWAMSDDDLDAWDELRKKRPQAVNVLLERVGYPEVVKMGFGFDRRTV